MMRSLKEIQEDFLKIQSEIGALELQKIGKFGQCQQLEAEFVKAKELADALEAAQVAQEAVQPEDTK